MLAHPQMSTSPRSSWLLWPATFVTGIILGIPTFATYISANMGAADVYPKIAAVLLFVLPIAFFYMRARLDQGIAWRGGLVAAGIIIPLLLSMAVHASHYTYFTLMSSLIRIGALALYMALVVCIVQNREGISILENAFKIMALFFALFFVYSSAFEPAWHYSRFTPGDMHPNWWGEAMLAGIFGSAFYKTRLLRYGLWLFFLAALVLIQSRGSLVSSLAVIGLAIIQTEGLKRLIVVSLTALAFFMPLFILVEYFVTDGRISQGVIDFVANTVLLLNDPYRGLGTGMTGRDYSYTMGTAFVTQHPVIGLGFGRTDEAFIRMSGTPIHNGHLNLMSDLGLPLYGVLLALMAGAIFRSIRMGEYASAGMIVGFMGIFMMFGPRSVNLSVLPMLFWMLVILAWIGRRGPAWADDASPATDRGSAQTAPLLGRRWMREPRTGLT